MINIVIITTALSAFIVLSITSCTKETATNNSVIDDTLAVFSPLASDDNCIPLQVEGTYHVGTPLSNNEKVIIEVNVTRKGEFKYSTDTLNGYYFSTAGSFTDTGIHVITLNGHGTPQIAGNSRFKFPKVELHQTIPVIDPTPVAAQPVPAGVFVKGKFGDQDINFTNLVATADGPSAYTSGDTVSFSSFINTGSYPNYSPGTGDLSLQKNYIYHYSNSTEADFKAFFAPGSYPISFTKCSSHIPSDGMWVAWVDDQSEFWFLRKDYDQEGSYFKILGNEDGYRTDGKYFVKVYAQLKCKLYHESTNEMKVIDVEISGYYVRP